jgi:hypothetical protein
MTVADAFGDVADIIASLNPAKVLDLRASDAMTARVRELVIKKKEAHISMEENAELERFLALDIFIGLAKARARIYLKPVA